MLGPFRKLARFSGSSKEAIDKEFPTDEGMPALLVFYREGKITDTYREKITELSEWFASNKSLNILQVLCRTICS